MFFILPLIVQTADITFQRASLQLIYRAIESPKHGTHEFREYFGVEREAENNVCDFRGIRCIEGKMVSFVIGTLLDDPNTYGQHAIAMDFLPSTLRVLAVSYVNMGSGWSGRYLPRELRAMHILHSRAPQARARNGRTFSFRDLPDKMVEIRTINSWGAGSIVVEGLPKSLRILHIQFIDLKSVHVNNESCPGLEDVYISNTRCMSNAFDVAISQTSHTASMRIHFGEVSAVRGALFEHFIRSEWDELRLPETDRKPRAPTADVCGTVFDD